MKELFPAFAVALVAFTAGFLSPHGSPAASPSCPGIEALISPGIAPEVEGLISSANSTLDVELFQFSYSPLMDALVFAKNRGVRVRVILEPRLDGDDNLDAASFLSSRGVPVRWATLSFSRTHSKLAIIDGKSVLVGSPNWSYSAMFKNRETAVILHGGSAAGEFSRAFEDDWAAATPA